MTSLQDAIADASASRSPDTPDAGPRSGAASRSSFPDEDSGRLFTVLIAALGGEGGGVLSNWLVNAAVADGRTVQATSVPGVAQRTGATTYYLEIGPRTPADAGIAPSPNETSSDTGSRVGAEHPVMALLPTPGNVDLLIASELLEAGRAAERGMITPDRTTVIASTHRTFSIAEKSAMGDGRFDDDRVRRAVRELACRHVLEDLGSVAESAGTVLSSVLLGAAAGCRALPIPQERLRNAIEEAGIAVEASLRGFDAAVRLLDARNDRAPRPSAGASIKPQTESEGPRLPSARLPAPLTSRLDALPGLLRGVARLGLERTVDFQDVRYGRQYLDRIEHVLGRLGDGGWREDVPRTAPDIETAAEKSGGSGASPAAIRVAQEVARQLALWMCPEDIIRVADLKTRRSRIDHVRSEVRAEPGQPVVITEFLKPGVDEWCSLLPAWLARMVLRAADRGGWRHRYKLRLRLRSSSVSGYVMLRFLARLKLLRRGMSRFREEQERIEEWLALVLQAGETSPSFALEAARCANLVKGYGDTRERGMRNFAETMQCLSVCAHTPEPASSLRELRLAALADPEGAKLDAAIAALRSADSEARPRDSGLD